MNCPRAMRFHAALGAAHCSGGLSHVEFFPVTQQKRFTLTRRQPRQSLLDEPHDLALLDLAGGVRGPVRVRFCRQSFKEVEIIIFVVLLAKGGEKGCPRGSHLLPTEMI